MRRTLVLLALSPISACGTPVPSEGNAAGESGGITLTADGSGDAGEDGDGDGNGDADDPDDGNQSGDADGGATLFDVGAPSGEGSCGGADGLGGDTLSYIWIANSGEGTVTKLNTVTMVEEGRYIVRADAAGSPSRTSVNLNGDVAIANRIGGVTKIFARAESCSESNGTPGIQTSTGAADVLPWGEEECVAWHNPLVCSSNRPMAWTRGTWSDTTCRYEDAKLWTECWNQTGPEVMLLDGETGAVEQSIPIPGVNTLVYGGAVDGDGNFWGVQSGTALIRVDFGDFSVQTWPTPTDGGSSYGIAVDNDGRPWLCGGGGASRFDIATGTYQTVIGAGIGIGGCMTDADGILWHSRYPDGVLVGIDTDTVAIVSTLAIPAYVHGVSIDFAGNVWGVTFGGSEAYRVDPDTGQVDTYAGLIGAYTYSDMTGFALSSAGTPSG